MGRVILIGTVLAFFLFLVCVPANAVTVQELLARIEKLEQRVAELERIIKQGEARLQESEQQQSSTSIIASFKGEGIQTTKLFTARGPWTLEWKATGDIFFATVRTKDGDYVNIYGGSQSGSSYIPRAGSYYLEVNSDGRWVVTIRAE